MIKPFLLKGGGLLKDRQMFLEEFEAKWRAIPDSIRESLPCRPDQIDFSFLEKESLSHIECGCHKIP